MDPAERWRLGRRPGLDGLRGVAIGLVIASHAWPQALGNAGMAGVTLFFALSGFLITALLLEEADRSGGRPSWRRFYGRRARRLLPALVPVLLAAVTLEYHFGYDPVGEVIGVLTYTLNWMVAFGTPTTLLAHTWSLAVEEQFYLIWPIVLTLALVRRVPTGRLARWCLIGAGISLVLRFGLLLVGVPATFVYYATPTRADALLVGCALAAGLHAGWRPSRRQLRAAAAGTVALIVGTALAMRLDRDAAFVVVPTTVMLAAVPLVWFASGSPRVLSGPVLRWLGRRSYALYLWHYLLVMPAHWGFPFLSAWWAIGLTFVAAEVSWWAVERPFMTQVTRNHSKYDSTPTAEPSSLHTMPMTPGVKAGLGLNADSTGVQA